MKENGFVRVGALVNKLSLGNAIENAKEISRQIKKLMRQELKSLLLPELFSYWLHLWGYVFTRQISKG